MAKQLEPHLEHENIVIVVVDVKHFCHDALSKNPWRRAVLRKLTKSFFY